MCSVFGNIQGRTEQTSDVLLLVTAARMLEPPVDQMISSLQELKAFAEGTRYFLKNHENLSVDPRVLYETLKGEISKVDPNS